MEGSPKLQKFKGVAKKYGPWVLAGALIAPHALNSGNRHYIIGEDFLEASDTTPLDAAEWMCAPGPYYFFGKELPEMKRLVENAEEEVRRRIFDLGIDFASPEAVNPDNVFFCHHRLGAGAQNMYVRGESYIGLNIKSGDQDPRTLMRNLKNYVADLRHEIGHALSQSPDNPTWRDEGGADLVAGVGDGGRLPSYVSSHMWGFLTDLAVENGYPENILLTQLYTPDPTVEFNESFLRELFSKVKLSDKDEIISMLLTDRQVMLATNMRKFLETSPNKEEWIKLLDLKKLEWPIAEEAITDLAKIKEWEEMTLSLRSWLKRASNAGYALLALLVGRKLWKRKEKTAMRLKI